MRFLEPGPRRDQFCSIGLETLALGAAGSNLLGGGLSFLGANSQAKRVRQAMQDYLNYVQGQRDTFLNQAESGAIRDKLRSYIGGDVGYHPETLTNMKAGVYEDYGKSLADMTRLTQRAGAGSTGVYTPGRADRTSRLLGQNLATNRATAMRDIATKNADVALNNQRLAISALPTYMPGLPATPTVGPDVFLKANEAPSPWSYLGPAISQAGKSFADYSIMGPIMQRMLEAQTNPAVSGLYLTSQYAPTPYANISEMQRRWFPTS